MISQFLTIDVWFIRCCLFKKKTRKKKIPRHFDIDSSYCNIVIDNFLRSLNYLILRNGARKEISVEFLILISGFLLFCILAVASSKIHYRSRKSFNIFLFFFHLRITNDSDLCFFSFVFSYSFIVWWWKDLVFVRRDHRYPCSFRRNKQAKKKLNSMWSNWTLLERFCCIWKPIPIEERGEKKTEHNNKQTNDLVLKSLCHTQIERSEPREKWIWIVLVICCWFC